MNKRILPTHHVCRLLHDVTHDIASARAPFIQLGLYLGLQLGLRNSELTSFQIVLAKDVTYSDKALYFQIRDYLKTSIFKIDELVCIKGIKKKTNEDLWHFRTPLSASIEDVLAIYKRFDEIR